MFGHSGCHFQDFLFRSVTSRKFQQRVKTLLIQERGQAIACLRYSFFFLLHHAIPHPIYNINIYPGTRQSRSQRRNGPRQSLPLVRFVLLPRSRVLLPPRWSRSKHDQNMIFYQFNDLQSRHQRELIHLWNTISSICSSRASGSRTRQARTSSKTFSGWRSSLRGSPALKVRLFSLLDLCWNFASSKRWRTPLYGLLDRRQRQCDVREQRPSGLYLHVFVLYLYL